MNIDWQGMFIPKSGFLELFLRGSIVYLTLFFLLRAIRREAGSLSITDVLMVVLIADAAQNGMAGEYRSVPEGLILCGTIIGWSYALDWLAFRFPALRPWLSPTPLRLIRHGQPQYRNLRKELITEDELKSQLRLQGVEEIADVKEAWIEPDGKISVIRYKPDESPQRLDRPAGSG